MKKIVLLCTFIACFAISKAQGNLQFNQIILFDITTSGTQAINVPAGKVWKIESVSMGSSGSTPDVFLRNSSLQNIAHFSAINQSSAAPYPYWLPSSFSGSFLNNNPSFRASISIIEFNVIP